MLVGIVSVMCEEDKCVVGYQWCFIQCRLISVSVRYSVFGMMVVKMVGYVFNRLMCEKRLFISWNDNFSMMFLNIFRLIVFVCVCRYVNGRVSVIIISMVNGQIIFFYSVILQCCVFCLLLCR